MAPYYDRAEDKMGVTGTHGIPRLPGNNNFRVLAAIFTAVTLVLWAVIGVQVLVVG